MLTNSSKAPKEDKSSDTIDGTKEKKEGNLIYHKCHKENHFSRYCKANIVKDKAFYLKMAQEAVDKEKVEKAFVAQVRRDHEVWPLGDEDEDNDNKKKRGKLCLVEKKKENTKELNKKYCFMAKEGSINIFEHVKFMIQSNNYYMHDFEPHLEKTYSNVC